MLWDSASELTDAFIAVMLQDLETTTNEENRSEGRDVSDVDLDQSDINPDTLRYIARFCRDFYIANEEHIWAEDACKHDATSNIIFNAGRGLYITLAGYSAEFGDSTYWDKTHGGAMYEYVQGMGHFDGAYIGDDGKVYL